MFTGKSSCLVWVRKITLVSVFGLMLILATDASMKSASAEGGSIPSPLAQYGSGISSEDIGSTQRRHRSG